LHGEAVGVGMLIAADMSARMGLLSATDVTRVQALLVAAGLPVAAPHCGRERALEYMSIDKKAKAGRIRLILLRSLGSAFMTGDYPDELLDATLATHFG
jgi:3-dehydroquinate synthetase